MAAPRKIDYERIEAGWRAGIKSPGQLAAEYTKETGVSVSHAAIINHFTKLGVPRDLKAKIKAKADAMVIQDMVRAKVKSKVTSATTKRDKEIIDVVAETVAEVRIVHRKDISRHRSLTVALLAELESQTGDITLFTNLAEILQDETADGSNKRNEIYNRVLSSPGRIDSLKKLSDTLKTLIGLERQAYDIGEVAGGDSAGSISISF